MNEGSVVTEAGGRHGGGGRREMSPTSLLQAVGNIPKPHLQFNHIRRQLAVSKSEAKKVTIAHCQASDVCLGAAGSGVLGSGLLMLLPNYRLEDDSCFQKRVLWILMSELWRHCFTNREGAM